jgi:hypothetical protein
VYRLVKFCQEKFPKEDKGTNSLAFSADEEYGASWSYSSYGYCYESAFQRASAPEDDATTFHLDVLVGVGGTIYTTMKAVRGPETVQTFAEFQAEVAAHGLVLADHAEGEPHYERNRITCDGENVPLAIDYLSKTIIHSTGGIMRNVTVARSTNMKDWSPLMTTQVSEGTGFRVVDTTREGQMFYRVTVL